MENPVKEIAGLTVEFKWPNKRIVRFNGKACPLIERTERLCELKTSFCGDVLDSTETYALPDGRVARRVFWARGAALERQDVQWDIVS